MRNDHNNALNTINFAPLLRNSVSNEDAEKRGEAVLEPVRPSKSAIKIVFTCATYLLKKSVWRQALAAAPDGQLT
eukprot:6176838-Pleurochrysis_carterae.AAC.3